MTTTRFALAFGNGVALLVTSVAWAQQPTRVTRGNMVFDEYPFAYVQRDALWKDTNIRVCWENPAPANAAQRAIVREAIKATWERESRLRFLGWGQCNAESKGIRILIADEGPHAKVLGRYLDARPNGMVLNFTFNNWSPSCKAQIEFCNRVIAVHEFGHAIGIAHEQNRSDAPAECRGEAQGPNGDWTPTVYDPDSVMNYCNPKWNGDGYLSANDILAVRQMYPEPQ